MINSCRNCNGVSRRDFIQLGLSSLVGLGMTDLMRLQAATPNTGKVKPGDMRCVIIWLDGGPTHYETFDPKPEAPSEIRGEFKPIKTNVPGIEYCEILPHLAKIADKTCVIRSICHNQNNHGAGNHYMMTGLPTPMPVNCGANASFHPSMGSVVSYFRGQPNKMPAYFALPKKARSGGPHMLGAEHAPFVIGGDPNREGFKVRDVVLPTGISQGRATTRRRLKDALDRMLRMNDKMAQDPAVDFDSYYEQGFDLISSREAQAAFDITLETDATRDTYGRNALAQRFLLARRLLEVGVPFINIYYGGWDHHVNIFESLKNKKVPDLDQGLAAFISDLDDRGLLESTLVITMGEFGRTPKINERGGRDHWSSAMSVHIAGGGVPPGQVVGATDIKGYYASDNIYTPQDLVASVYAKMGIDPFQHLHTETGKPVQLVYDAKLIKELF